MIVVLLVLLVVAAAVAASRQRSCREMADLGRRGRSAELRPSTLRRLPFTDRYPF